MLKYKMIVSDLDGTLLNDKSELTQRTIDAIARYRELGGLFTYATGRTDESARPLAERAGVNIPGIAYNGGKIVYPNGGETIFETFLDSGCAIKVYSVMREMKKNVVAYFERARYVGEFTNIIEKYMGRVRHSVFFADDIANICDAGALKKLLIIDPEHERDKILDKIMPIFGDKCCFIMSDPDYFEFLPPDTSKGNALKILAAHLGVGLEDTAAIGDHLNDVSMIEIAGLGVAVANAVPEAIAAAGYVTSSNEDDGAARFIEFISNGAEPGEFNG